jgi:hypothetical protein
MFCFFCNAEVCQYYKMSPRVNSGHPVGTALSALFSTAKVSQNFRQLMKAMAFIGKTSFSLPKEQKWPCQNSHDNHLSAVSSCHPWSKEVAELPILK